MQLEVRKLLRDMLGGAKLIEEFTRGQRWEDYAADAKLRSAVERQFEIVGEALTQVKKSFRNVLIHNYGKINNAVTWQIVQQDLPVLLRELDSMLTEPDA